MSKGSVASSMRKLFIFLVLVGCRVGPAYYPPEVSAPAGWKHQSNAEAQTPYACNWWDVFDDQTLDLLEWEAVNNNKELYIALDRVMQARALVGIEAADLYPQLNLAPLYNNQGILVKNFAKTINKKVPGPSVFREHQLSYSLPLNLSYEIDLWGKLRDRFESAYFHFQAQEDRFRTALLLLTSDVANTYYQIRAIDALIELYKRTIATRKKAFEINLDRYQYKINNYSAVALSGLDLSNAETQYYQAIQQRELHLNALALLLGRPPIEVELVFSPLKSLPPVIPADIPSTVLLQRPDVAEAERTMASEHALVQASYASLYPSFTLTGALGFLSPDYKHFLEWISRFWQIGVNGNQVVFDGGRIASEIDQSWANFQEASDTYQQTVLVAFKEVEDALVSIEWLAKEAESVQSSVHYASKAYQISMERYLQGVDFYLQVADNERQLLDNERAAVTILQLRYTATIQLIKAMGGRWSSFEDDAVRQGTCDLEVRYTP